MWNLIIIKKGLIYKRIIFNKKDKIYLKNILLIFAKIFILILVFLFLKKKNIFKFNNKYIKHFFEENNTYKNKFLILKNIQLYINNSLINEEKKNFFNFLSKETHKKISFINTLFYTVKRRFGNALCNLNKLIFYCEIIGCKNIILDKKIFWFIKNTIKIMDNNLTIQINDKNKYKYSNILYYDSNNIFNYFYKIKPEIKINFLKFEIIKNLPKFDISKEDLYIHLRGEDIFDNNINIRYAQPPLCFYQTILNTFTFKKIYLISKDKNNPIINKLINYYPNIIYNKNSLKEDISYLVNAYNIIASISSFLLSIIQLNNNLNYLWDYNIYQMADKYRHYHYDLYKLPNTTFTIYRMESSTKYKVIMYKWKNNRKQRKLMIKDKCLNFFSIINYKL